MKKPGQFLSIILLACVLGTGCATKRPDVDSMADAIVVTAADIETAAQTVRELCGNTVAGGECRQGALISTTAKNRMKVQLYDAVLMLRSANRALAARDGVGAGDNLAAAKALLQVLQTELRRYQ